jgi:hypothetical protein
LRVGRNSLQCSVPYNKTGIFFGGGGQLCSRYIYNEEIAKFVFSFLLKSFRVARFLFFS